MKKIGLFAILGGILLIMATDAAPAPRGRGGATATPAAAPAAVSARAGARQAPVATAPAAVSARAGVRSAPVAAAPTSAVSARSGTTPAGAPAVVSARSGTKTSTINKGVVVSEAVAATGLYSDECKAQLEGCLDQFCFVGNENGARCNCNDEKVEIDKIAEEIALLETKARNISTIGVEQASLGAKANIIFGDGEIKYDEQGNVMTAAQAAAAAEAEANKNKPKRTLTFSDLDEYEDEYSEFDELLENGIATKTGNDLFRDTYNMCRTSLPSNCNKDLSMLLQLYQGTIKSDCNAYRIELESRKKQMGLKLAEAEKMVRDASLEAFEEQNKYNRGECMVEYRNCMADEERGGCGADFSGCAGAVAEYNATLATPTKIVGKLPDVEVTVTFDPSTMEVLESKRHICERVLDSCMSVRQYVWGDFLREIAPTMRRAELNAESNLRQNCLVSVSDCVKNACQSDLAGTGASMDACLANPEMARSFCKVQLDPCERMDVGIWEFVKAKLGAMRVDACTEEVKSCFKNESRCGEDYTGCVGTDIEYLKELCPLAALPVCTQSGKKDWDSDISQIAMGIFLNIDNELQDACQKFVNEKMMETCGSLSDCNAFAMNDSMGTGSLRSAKLANGDYQISGLIQFGKFTTTESVVNGKGSPGVFKLNEYGSGGNEAINVETAAIKEQINRVIDILRTDPDISNCIDGRDMTQSGYDGGTNNKTTARFPNMLLPVSATIITAALNQAQTNYAVKFKEELDKATENASAELANWKCIQITEGLGELADTSSNIQTATTLTIPMSGIKTSSLKTISDREPCPVGARGKCETWTTWSQADRICTQHKWVQNCRRDNDGWFTSSTKCDDPIETAIELPM